MVTAPQVCMCLPHYERIVGFQTIFGSYRCIPARVDGALYIYYEVLL
jgi:hypothetical protein